MDIQSAALNELFVLYPVIIPGWVSPVKPAYIAHGGIPKSLYDGQPKGLECLVDPWTEACARTLAVDDRVDLYINNDPTPVTGKTVDPGEERLRMRLYVPHGRLRHGVNRLHYKVTRPSGIVKPSRDLNVLYHLRSPGEPAPKSLSLVIPPDVITYGVSAEWAVRGVTFGFDYANRRTHDRIRFLLGDVTVEWEVLDTSVPETRTLFTDTFQHVGDNPNTLVDFVVFDQLGNFSQSPTKRLDIHLDRLALSAPTVKGMTGTHFNPTQPEVRVVVPQGSLLPSDKLTVIWKGASDVPTGSYISPQRPVSAGLEIAVPRSMLAYSLNKTVTVSYVIERNGKPSTSPPLNPNILALSPTALIPPKILEADANNLLDVIALGTANATIHALPWTLIEAGQPCWLSLEGQRADGTAHNLQLWNGLPAQVNAMWVNQGFWPAALASNYLKQLGPGSTLTIKFKASLDKSNDPAKATVFPDRLYTIKALPWVSPTITSVKGGSASGPEIPHGTSTHHTTLVLKGRASANKKIDLFDKGAFKATVNIGPTQEWTHTLTSLAQGDHGYSVTPNSANRPGSTARTLKIFVPLSDEVTRFKNGLNGWEIGPAARDPKDIALGTYHGRTGLTNSTHTNNCAGVVLHKSFSNLIIGRTYEFSILAANGEGPHLAVFSLQTNAGTTTGQFTPPRHTWSPYSVRFTAQSLPITLSVVSHVATRDANDYFLTELRIKAA
ncbi:hypothetical protein [Pseudomonas sp. P9_31]|uniref:hypothetical protein n=1 Tax=Pseudomonas sp. P9_31 TaxID=3043448 RepID=UPI002A35A8B6|nr:hypothetical protein [Pseudomonas sp. P9_31]WPN56564.1 hypothetical protein QMK51_20840 [Pseudomonas sp. P9_31]